MKVTDIIFIIIVLIVGLSCIASINKDMKAHYKPFIVNNFVR